MSKTQLADLEKDAGGRRRGELMISFEREDRDNWIVLLDGRYVADLSRSFSVRYSASGAGLYARDHSKPCTWALTVHAGPALATVFLDPGIDARTAKLRAETATLGALR